MPNISSFLTHSLISGTVASGVSAAVLAVLANAEGKRYVQPMNATSHWLHGEAAGDVNQVDAKHTGTGLATHQGACFFWGLIFEALRSTAPDAGPARIVRDAATVSTVAAVVDYGLLPKYLTPGWEGPLPIRSIAGGFAGLALGFALGGLLTSRFR
jgi:hypothetical protein